MIINGYKEPRFLITSSGDAPVTVAIDLPLTNDKGLIESYDIKKIQHELIDYSTVQSIKGYIIHFTLNYDIWITGETLMKIKQILDSALAGSKIQLMPRVDLPARIFEVYVSMDTFSLGILQGNGFYPQAHQYPVLVFSTKYLQDSLDWSLILPPSDPLSGAGGTGLGSPIEGQIQT
jgi:hypothetical protein